MPSFFGTLGTQTFRNLRPNASGRIGVITLSLRLFSLRYGSDSSWASKAAPSGLKIIYTLDGLPITGEVKWPYTATFDSKEKFDGYHSLAIILVDAALPALTPASYRVVARAIKLRNGTGSATMLRVPTHGFLNRTTNYHSFTTDWLVVPMQRPKQAPMPFPYVTAPPANKGADPAKYRNAKNWIAEPLTQVSSGLYHATPSWYRDADGDPYVDMFYGHTQPELEASMDRLWKIDFYDGLRSNNSISPYSSYAYDWNSADIYGVDLIGRFFRIAPDGSVLTLLGPRGDPTAIPYKGDAAFYNQQVGRVTDGTSPDLMCAIDIAQDRNDPAIWYISDMDRERIVTVKVGLYSAEMSTYVEGLNWPAAMYTTPDGSMVIAEMGTTEHDPPLPPGIAIVAPDKSIRRLDLTGTNLKMPFCLRPTSDWQIIVCDRSNNHIYEINPDTGVSRLIADTRKLGPGDTDLTTEQWTWLAVDRTGSIGPVDDIVVVQYTGAGNIKNYRIPRHDPPANPVRPFWTSSGGYCRVGAAEYTNDQPGHYPWAVAISERECRILFYGGGGDGLLSYRGRVAADPLASFDITAFNNGRSIFVHGTAIGFPHGMRPTFTSLLNQNGHSRTGVPSFDEIAGWDDAKLKAWIQAGMGGVVARPEIVGYQLACLMYYIRKDSTLGLLRAIPGVPLPADKTMPVISEVGDVVILNDGTVNWKTNEPTLGYVAFGSSANYHRWSAPEKAFGTTHQAKLEHMPAVCHYSVRCTDQAGNVVFASDVKLR